MLVKLLVVLAALGVATARPQAEETTNDGCPSDQSEYFLPHEWDCGRYYTCENGVKLDGPQTCDPGTEFSVDLQGCTHPLLADCRLSGSPPRESSESHDDSSSSSEESKEEEDVCKSSCNAGNWAHETDCDKFWSCKGGKQVLVFCAEGLHFNAATQTCDYKCSAGCNREVIQFTQRDDGITVFVPGKEADNPILELYIRMLQMQ